MAEVLRGEPVTAKDLSRLVGVAERDVADHLAQIMSWTRPNIPAPGDPAPYVGSPALG